jgi:UDP-N-acetyl-D-mannosaminuronic acid dehydrogenase
MQFEYDVIVVGGCGHVGLPLGLAFADRGLNVALYDLNEAAVQGVMAGHMPFQEPGAAPVLERVIGSRLVATSDSSVVSKGEHVIVVVGTPVDEHLNPDPTAVSNAVRELAGRLHSDQLLILRSTLYPGTTALVERTVQELGLNVGVAFCPERIAEGKAMTELYELPQIVAARTDLAFDRAQKLFRTLTDQTVKLSPEEAELANTWRYIKFATANQLFMMANDFGVDYERIRAGLALDYPRASDLPRAGFAAGPCLLKDTMQLAAFNKNNFVLGHAAMMVNEGLPMYLVSKLEKEYPLSDMTVGILGMAFKEESDDVRSSLSYKLKRILRFKSRAVMCHDPFVASDPDLVDLDQMLATVDLLIIGAPHAQYRTLHPSVPLIDIWGLHDEGSVP